MKIPKIITRAPLYSALIVLSAAIAQAGFQAPDAEKPPAGALPTGTGLFQSTSLIGTVALVIQFALGFLGIITLSIMLFAGFQYAIAGGDDEKTKKAVKMISNAIVGLIIIFFAFVLSNAILGFVFDQPSGGITQHSGISIILPL